MAGYYTDELQDDFGNIITQSYEIPEGVKMKNGLTLQSLDLQPGFWRVSLNDTTIRKCPKPEFCIGGRLNGQDGLNTSVCKEGHMGPFCGVCQAPHLGFSPGYAMSQGQCISCEGNKAATYVAAGMAVVGGFLGIVYLVHYLESHHMLSLSAPSEMKTKQAKFKAILLSFRVFIVQAKVQAKVLASYFQITTSLSFNLDIFFDGFYREFMKVRLREK